MKVTVKQFAEKQGVAPATANAVLGFLVAKGVATKAETEKVEGAGKGRPAVVYEVPETVTLSL